MDSEMLNALASITVWGVFLIITLIGWKGKVW